MTPGSRGVYSDLAHRRLSRGQGVGTELQVTRMIRHPGGRSGHLGRSGRKGTLRPRPIWARIGTEVKQPDCIRHWTSWSCCLWAPSAGGPSMHSLRCMVRAVYLTRIDDQSRSMRRTCIEPSAVASPRKSSDPHAGTVVCRNGRVMELVSHSNGTSVDLDGLGHFVRAHRQTLDLTQQQLAQRLGWVQERISLLEHGKYGLPSLPSLARLADALEIELGRILVSVGYDGAINASEQRTEREPATSAALLYTLERLLAIDEVEPRDVLCCASSMIAEVMSAEKVDAFMFDSQSRCLVAAGTSDTPMGRKQQELGLDRIPTWQQSREVEVYASGDPHHTGHADDDPNMTAGFVERLAVRSLLLVALDVAGERRGILAAASSGVDQFSIHDLVFFEAVARWIGLVVHRSELISAKTSSLLAEHGGEHC
jgi:transcriptional regulator with XRE-family HTH domain